MKRCVQIAFRFLGGGLLGGLCIFVCASCSSRDTKTPDTSSDSDSVDGGEADAGPWGTDTFDNDNGPDYASIFPENRLPIYALHIDDDEWIRLLVDADEYVQGDLTVDGVLYPNVGVRILGNTDRAKVSLRIRFDFADPNQTFFGVKRLNLHSGAGDTSLIREALALSLMRDAGVPAPQSAFAWVTTDQGFGGVYTLIEQVDKKFLTDRFNENSGNLYKAERGASLSYLGDDPASYPEAVYELKTNEDANDRSDLIHFTNVLNETTSTELDEVLPEVLDIDGFLRWLAVNTFIVSMDSYAGTEDNYYFYHGTDGRFRFIPWDLNQAFGNYHGASCSGAGALECETPMGVDEYLTLNAYEPYCACATGMRPLIERVLERPVFRNTYREIFAELLDTVLDVGNISQQARALRRLIDASAHDDTQKDCYALPCTNDLFDASLTTDDPESDIRNRVPGILPFVEQRDQVVRETLGLPPLDARAVESR